MSGQLSFPDEEIDELVKMYNPDKTTCAVVEFVNIAGLVKGASKGQGLETSSCQIYARLTQLFMLSVLLRMKILFMLTVRLIRFAILKR